MQPGSSVGKNAKRGHRRTMSLISPPLQTLLNFPKSSSGISTPVETEVAHGSFTPTSSAFPCLTTLITSDCPGSVGYSRRPRLSLFDWPDVHSQTGGGSDTSSVPASPTSSFSSAPSVPGISRTSSYEIHSSTSSTPSLLDETHPIRAKPTEMNPILSELERRSKLCKLIMGCATCGKPGSDYPRCGKCGEMWCSRPCRLRGGKKHICVAQV